MCQALCPLQVGLEVSVLGKSDTFPGQTVSKQLGASGLKYCFFSFIFLGVTIMVFLLLRLESVLPFSGGQVNHDVVTVKKTVPLKTAASVMS